MNREHAREEAELTRQQDAFDHRTCARCELPIAFAFTDTRAGFLYHRACAEGMCHFCGELLLPADEISDPTREPFRFMDMGDRAHLECCREAAWESGACRESDMREALS